METFELTVAQRDGRLAVLEVGGYINNEAGEAIASTSAALLAEGHRVLLLDLGATRIINSIGISLLLEVLEKIMERQGTLAFCSLSPSIAKTFQIMGLAQYTKIFPSRAEALASLAPSP